VDGHVYAVAHHVDGVTTTLVEVTPEGVIDLADIAGSSVVLPINGAFLTSSGRVELP